MLRRTRINIRFPEKHLKWMTKPSLLLTQNKDTMLIAIRIKNHNISLTSIYCVVYVYNSTFNVGYKALLDTRKVLLNIGLEFITSNDANTSYGKRDLKFFENLNMGYRT